MVDRIPDGLILEAIECWGKSLESLAKYFRVEVWSIRKRRSRALGYVASGPDRRWHNTHNKDGKLKREAQTYQEFKRRRK